jgi:hypothetical protein
VCRAWHRSLAPEGPAVVDGEELAKHRRDNHRLLRCSSVKEKDVDAKADVCRGGQWWVVAIMWAVASSEWGERRTVWMKTMHTVIAESLHVRQRVTKKKKMMNKAMWEWCAYNHSNQSKRAQEHA